MVRPPEEGCEPAAPCQCELVIPAPPLFCVSGIDEEGNFRADMLDVKGIGTLPAAEPNGTRVDCTIRSETTKRLLHCHVI